MKTENARPFFYGLFQYWKIILSSSAFCLILLLARSASLSYAQWQHPPQPAAPSQLTDIAPHPFDGARVLAASDDALFEKEEDGRWLRFGGPFGGISAIRKLGVTPADPRLVFILTDEGVYELNLLSRENTAVFRPEDKAARTVLSFAVHPQSRLQRYAGTAAGLYVTSDGGKNWSRAAGIPEKAEVSVLEFAGPFLFAAAGSDLYRSRDPFHFEKIFSLSPVSVPEFSAEKDPDPEEEFFTAGTSITGTAFSPADETLWLATGLGLYETRDFGENWRRVSDAGLRTTALLRLVYVPPLRGLAAGTGDGIFLLDPETGRWKELVHGLDNLETRSLIYLDRDVPSLAVLTRSGFSYHPLPDGVLQPAPAPDTGRLELFRKLLLLEPSAHDVHNAVIRYNDLANGKIKRWHAASRLRALVPGFSFGKDFSRSNNLDLDRGTTNDPDVYIAGPDDVGSGWDMDMSWNFSNAVWDSAQTSIDSRSKINAEFRRDMLAEATRIYYERRRVQLEMIAAPPAALQAHFETLVRIDELTSLLDAVTGGWMSGRVEKIYRENEEMRELWAPPRQTNLHENNTNAHEDYL
ncbi:MAG: hypothetical protein A2Z83_00490 [Omnitrophica bacterium GWA2_52_8]|nr:MAG: hypothetical protein A2Z83_00490 [Omnitrophica bacterium GWA2_52_8]